MISPIYLIFIVVSVGAQELLSNQRCNLAADRGECTNFAVKWHYDRYAHRCRQFYFGGCGGNENRFDTMEECDGQCRFVDNSVRERCSQPYDAGHCHSDISRHYFDMDKGACICANYTGCGGNNNMFYSFDQCMSVCGQFAKPNHIQIHDNTHEYSHGGHADLTPLQLLQKQNEQIIHHQQSRHHQQTPSHHNQQQDAAHQQRYQELLRLHEEQRKRHHPVLRRPQSPHSVAHEPYEEDLGHMKHKREEQTDLKTAEFSSTGVTTIHRHSANGTQYITTINGHPVRITETIMKMVKSGDAESIDQAIDMLAASKGNYHLTATSKPQPNFVFLDVDTQNKAITPQYQYVPKQTVVKKVTSSSTYQNLPREAFIRPVDPEERRIWKEKMKKKINPVRRIDPSPYTYYEIYTTPQPVVEPVRTTRPVPTTRPVLTTTTTTRPTTTTTTRAPTTTRLPATTTLPRPVTTVAPTQPSSFYQESFDLSKIRKHKESVRNGKLPPQRPMDDYDDDRVPYETEISEEATLPPTVRPTARPTVPPTVPTTVRPVATTVRPTPRPTMRPTQAPTPPPTVLATTTRATVVLPVSREDLAPTPHTMKVLPSLIYPTASHFDLEEGKENKEEEEYEYEDEEEDDEGLDDIENQLTITQRIEQPTTTVPPPTTTHRPTVPPPRPTVPYRVPATVAPTFATRAKEAMEKPLQLAPPSFDQTTSSTTTARPLVAVTTPRPRVVPTEASEEDDSVATTRKSLWGSYESEEFDIRPASRGSI